MAKEIPESAKQVYATLISMLDGKEWRYERHDEDLVIKSGLKGDDLPIEFIVVVRPENEVVQFCSRLPFNMPEDKRVDAAIAVCVANYGLVDGSFDYDIADGEIRYRLTCSYRGNQLTEDVFEYIIMCAASTVDRYNDRFFMLMKNMLTLQQFIEMDRS